MNAKAHKPDDGKPVLPDHAPKACLTALTDDGKVSCDTTVPIVIVGSRRDCGLPITHPDVSKVHCAIINTGRSLLICDLLSRTGTFVNNKTVRTSVLKPDDALRAGPVEIELKMPPSNVRVSGEAKSREPVPPLTLEIAGQRVDIAERPVLIGRRNGADIIIDTPDVSLAHAVLFPVDGRPAVCDLGSRSGTFVNGEHVDQSWIEDGDELRIGGESIRIRWERPIPPDLDQFDVLRALSRDRARKSTNGVKPGGLPLGAGDLQELEQTITSIQGQILNARSQIEQRATELDRREVEFKRKLEELTPVRQALTAAQQKLEKRERELERQAAALEKQSAALEKREKAFGDERGTLDRVRAELDAGRAALADQIAAHELAQNELETRQRVLDEATAAAEKRSAECEQLRQKLEVQRGELEQALAAQAEATAALEAREQGCAQLEEELRGREAQVALREAQIRERESQEDAARSKIEEFKSALQKASSLFTQGGVEMAANAGDPEPPDKSGGSKKNGKGGEGGSGPSSGGAPTGGKAEAAGSTGLPAPLVEEPLFSANASAPPADWPGALRERFHVLRRMSKKSDEEIMMQVWEEREKTLAEAEAAKPKKRARFLWRN